MRITHYTIRDVRELNGVQGAAPEWDVVAKCDSGDCFYSPGTFDSVDDANRFITKQFSEREIFDDYWEGQPLYPYEIARLPHDAWIMVPALEEEPDDEPTLEAVAAYVKAQTRDQGEVMNKRPSPPVSNYDDEAEHEDRRPSCIMEQAEPTLARPKKGSWEDVFGHLGTPEEVGNMWHALTERVDRVEAMRHAIYHAEAEIKLMDDGIYGNYEVILWRIRGVPKTFYPTKMAAEVAARAHFPHDNATVRYSRVSFITVPIDSDNFESD